MFGCSTNVVQGTQEQCGMRLPPPTPVLPLTSRHPGPFPAPLGLAARVFAEEASAPGAAFFPLLGTQPIEHLSGPTTHEGNCTRQEARYTPCTLQSQRGLPAIVLPRILSLHTRHTLGHRYCPPNATLVLSHLRTTSWTLVRGLTTLVL